MTIKKLDQLNAADPNNLPDLFREIALGNVVLGQVTQQLRQKTAGTTGANPYNLSTVGTVVLPDNAKASRVLRCTARAGSVTGEFTEKAGYGTTPTTGTVGVAPNGDLVFLGTDAVTNADLTYVPENGDVLELVLPVVAGTGVLTIPSGVVTQGVILLLEAEALDGTATGKKIILVPASSAVAAGRSALNIAKSTVWFAIADAVTRARVKLLLCPAKAVQTVLTADATYS